MGAEGKSGEFVDFPGGALGEFRMGVEAGADGGAPDGEVVESVEDLFEALDVALEKAGPAAELLADGHGYGVLQVSAADLHDVFEFFCLDVNSVVDVLDRGNERALHPFGGGDVHGSGEGVVRGL